MFIQHITIENFGAIRHYDTDLRQGLNIVESRYATELHEAISFLACNDQAPGIPEQWLRDDLLISATICLEDTVYTVCIRSVLGRPQMFATDPTGADATAQYKHALSHCEEQNSAELFGGWEPYIHLRLCDYCDWDARDFFSDRTDRLTDTKTFHRYLYNYIRSFVPEPINSKKNYLAAINQHGEFEVILPGFDGEIHLSETEKRLFYYICFLNVAEFWAGFEAMRDLHHEQKPLLIQDFLEFLDEGADISSLITRTQNLQRQIIILTSPLGEELIKKWVGENNGIFLKSCSAICSLQPRSQLYPSGKAVTLAVGRFGGSPSPTDYSANRKAG